MTRGPRLDPGFLTRPLAHRTLHDVRAGRPENSLSGARAAVLAGYGIEVDIQRSADRVAMVFHDDVLDRLTARGGPVAALSAADLSKTRLTHGTEGIPTLGALLEVVSGRVPLLIEVKDQTGSLGDADAGLENAVAQALAGYPGPVAVMSFNPHSVARLAKLLPGVARGLVTDPFARDDWPEVSEARLKALRAMPDLDRVGATFVSHNWRDLGAPAVAQARASGRDVLTWTVRSPDEEAVARKVAQNVTFERYLSPVPA